MGEREVEQRGQEQLHQAHTRKERDADISHNYSGIGLGIGQRFIDEFAALYPSPTTHLTLITTTRTAAKSRATTEALRKYLDQQEDGARITNQKRTLFPNRIHLASIELDLCNLPSVYAAAERLKSEPIEVFTGLTPSAAPTASPSGPPVPAVIPRLDSVIFNAGIGGWTQLNWSNLVKSFFASGFVHATTFPTCKDATGGLLVDPLTGKEIKDVAGSAAVEVANKPGTAVLGQVFCANVFGHYLFAHELLPLLSTGSASAVTGPLKGSAKGPEARIIWESSIESMCWKYLSMDDFQGVGTITAYESSKRLTDLLSLTADLDGVKAYSAPFFEGDSKDEKAKASIEVPPATYVTHPGIVCSTLFPLHWIVFYLYQLGMYISRIFGSPWHPVTPYKGAAAAVWVALQEQPALEALDARHVKWGAGTTWTGSPIVKRTEVEGWGWRGKVNEEQYRGDKQTDPLVNTFRTSYLRNSLGRREDSVALTAERRQEFEVLGRDCWREMERLRLEWDAKVRKIIGR